MACGVVPAGAEPNRFAERSVDLALELVQATDLDEFFCARKFNFELGRVFGSADALHCGGVIANDECDLVTLGVGILWFQHVRTPLSGKNFTVFFCFVKTNGRPLWGRPFVRVIT